MFFVESNSTQIEIPFLSDSSLTSKIPGILFDILISSIDFLKLLGSNIRNFIKTPKEIQKTR